MANKLLILLLLSFFLGINYAALYPTVGNSLTVPQTMSVVINSSGATGGISPYTYNWFVECPGCATFTLATTIYPGNYVTNTIVYVWSTNALTTLGRWQFQLQGIDSGANIINSIAVNVIVTPVNVLYGLTASTGITVSNSNTVAMLPLTSGTGISITSTNTVNMLPLSNTLPIEVTNTNQITLAYNSYKLGLDINNFLTSNVPFYTGLFPVSVSNANIISCLTCIDAFTTQNGIWNSIVGQSVTIGINVDKNGFITNYTNYLGAAITGNEFITGNKLNSLNSGAGAITSIIGVNGIIASTSGSSVTLAVNVITPVTNTLGYIGLLGTGYVASISGSGAFSVSTSTGAVTGYSPGYSVTGAGLSLSTANVLQNTGVISIGGTGGFVTSSSTGSVTGFAPVYTVSNGLSLSSGNLITVNVLAPLTNYSNLGLGFGANMFLTVNLLNSLNSGGGGATYTANFPIVISSTNVISLVANGIFTFNTPLTLYGTPNTLSAFVGGNSFISGNHIDSSGSGGTTYSAGNGIKISGSIISANILLSPSGNMSWVNTAINAIGGNGMEPLIYYFAAFSMVGLILMAIAYLADTIRPTEQRTENGKTQVVKRYNYLMKIGEYLFAVMFLAMALQINVDFAGNTADLATSGVLVSIAIAILLILLLSDLLVVVLRAVNYIQKGL